MDSIRYSYENTAIDITAFATEDEVTMSVKDNGIGIDPKYLPRIFDKYFRVPGNEKEGTGLGLAISNESIKAIGRHNNCK